MQFKEGVSYPANKRYRHYKLRPRIEEENMMTRRQKKFCSLLAAIALLFGMLPTLSASAASMPSGSGTERDPYILTNASELAFMEDLPDA